ncbi:hypothetical protein BJY00DRAFT_310313 [Aspergillus carlsbadensis]|nr:hypothetical protein BJY00DRAFT_310313 [Aspergillus carlsbadensis]
MRRLTKHFFPKSSREKQERTELDEASRLVQLRYRLGALYFDVSRPVKTDNYIRAQVHRYTKGEDGSRVPDVSEEEKGFVSAGHVSFEPYWKKYFFRSGAGKSLDEKPEARVFTEIESDSRYLNMHPATITVEGFGRECWNYEQTVRNPYNIETTTNECKHTFAFARLEERMVELEKQAQRTIGLDRAADDKEVMEFVGDLGTSKNIGGGKYSQSWWIPQLYSVLYRKDWLMDINRLPHIAQEVYTEKGWASKAKLGQHEFFYAMVLAKELLRRLEVDDKWYPEFANALWVQLIVADQWFRNVQLKAVRTVFEPSKPAIPATDEEGKAVEMTRCAGDRALECERYDKAIELYTRAIELDSTNATTRCQKVRALLAKGIYSAAVQEACIAARDAQKSKWAWHYLGLAYLQAGAFTRAKASFEMALSLVDAGQVPSGLHEALTKAQEEIDSGKAPYENKHPVVCWMGVSTISQQQIEGIIRFAEEMQWPYLDEVREHVQRVCDDVSTGKCWIAVLHDWFCGLSLPGARFAHNIMPALIFCSPSRPEALEYYCQFEGGTTGVVFQDKSYWRVRSILGRVLGCLPGVTCVGGWTGPCPATEGVETPRTVYLAAKQVAPVEMRKLSSHQDWESRQASTSATDIKDDEQWVIPQPPSTRSRQCKLLSIRLEKLPISKELLEIEKHERGWDSKRMESRRGFRAHVRVHFDAHGEKPHQEEYTLLHNSIFVTLPPCVPGQDRAHKEHVSRLRVVDIAVEKLRETAKRLSPDKTLIINATGEGAEVAARAWCTEVGRHAIVRRAGGPCVACTLRGASRVGLGVGTVIWVS